MSKQPINLYRIQDANGRGPFKPGFSDKWIEHRDDHENLLPLLTEFPDIQSMFVNGTHYGTGCRRLKSLRRWFTPAEYSTLLRYGYKCVRITVNHIIAQSLTQCVFARARPLNQDAVELTLYEAMLEGKIQ